MKPVVRRRPRSWPVLLLALPAFVAIWAGWVGLGELTGFGIVHPLPGIWDELSINTAITLPIGVETYAAYALHVWLSGGGDERTTTFAKWSALGSLVLGAAGQVAYHLMVAAGITQAPWQITAVVACLPVAVLGMGAALAHMVAGHHTPATTDEQHPATGHGDDVPVQEEPGPELHTPPPTPAPVSTPAPTPAPASGVASGAGPVRRRTGAGEMAARVRRLREKYPDWTHAQIGQKAGCAERTVRRHLSTAPAPTTATDTATDTPATSGTPVGGEIGTDRRTDTDDVAA